MINTVWKEIKKLPAKLGMFLIKIYQFTLSTDHAFWVTSSTPRVCRFYPSCSQYTYEAIDRFGLIRGSIMGFFRIMRCNPASKGGDDPVPEEFSIKRNLK